MKKSVKSINPCLAGRQACKSVIQTNYDIVRGVEGEIRRGRGFGVYYTITILNL